MSVSMWSYRPEVCDGGGCPGDCDLCDKPKNMEDEDEMSASKWAYDPMMCDGDICVGDCDLCDKPKIVQIHNTATTQVPTDYIKREDAIAEFKTNGSATVYGIDQCKAIISRLKSVPSADVVEVVRCKDCKYHAEFSSKCNKLHLTPMRPNDYCSYGEREEP